MKETPLICTYQNEVCYFFIVTKYKKGQRLIHIRCPFLTNCSMLYASVTQQIFIYKEYYLSVMVVVLRSESLDDVP